MDIILKQDVENLGFEFEIVSVKPGYARNFLIPQGKAVIATTKQREELNKILETRKAEESALISAAEAKSAKLNGLDVKIEAKVGAGDKLFGSVNNGDLADALVAAGVEIEKKNIKIPGNTIKRLGKNTAKIRFHRDVEVDFEFEVVADKESIQRAEEAAKARAEVARMDAERLANANKSEETGFNYDNPLYEKKPAVKEEAPATETPSEEA
ncbi:large subunit ribosomal protein L9 [Moheibacter stercoris]|uniref:Large ribosomal subunit protein bL9 n=1 Tax=Moheibacter stercoris TaxID=1628251 RepID=A0ABV2LU80_9FLAO